MAIENGGHIKSLQKLSRTIPSQSWPAGSTVKVGTMPNTEVVNPENSIVQNVWWMALSGLVNQPISIFADVTGVDEISIVVNNPGAAFTASLRIGGAVIEYE